MKLALGPELHPRQKSHFTPPRTFVAQQSFVENDIGIMGNVLAISNYLYLQFATNENIITLDTGPLTVIAAGFYYERAVLSSAAINVIKR